MKEPENFAKRPSIRRIDPCVYQGEPIRKRLRKGDARYEDSREYFNKLTGEQKKLVENAASKEELLAIAKHAGQELTQEQLDSMAGGGWLCDLIPCCEYDD